jgi:hypothetical protein
MGNGPQKAQKPRQIVKICREYALHPLTFTFQPGVGRMFINDVGENTWEEINHGIAGSNYGWPGRQCWNLDGPGNGEVVLAADFRG